ncbi:hypothetical protein FNO01nite_09380 [Flavobacterium noncentrifugens]|uniref:DoxX protein n=1 Tax=Flavobacterium noncentrifugens TaxID=1128970 RepID=A0A1G8UYT0_9FLAO|nr:DoxX family protein [Flavobacterium noncentrifugens]GEP50266.1 hypothetical protein FNO01nite_09380 [Flavobacterium noncentrifugens]SDJ58879.1 hypothetical protein SAMN04487935_1106 [Flavobacterium noncentrifugens]
MKIATIIVRILLGLMFLFASVTYFFHLMPPPPPPQGNTKVFMDGLNASGYIMDFAKAIELLCGLAFLSGRFVALANVVLFPITINILLINIMHMPEGAPIAVALFVAQLFLFYVYRQKYAPLFESK